MSAAEVAKPDRSECPEKRPSSSFASSFDRPDVISDFPAYVLKPGRPWDDAKLITITTLQRMVNIYREHSSGYFDLVVSDSRQFFEELFGDEETIIVDPNSLERKFTIPERNRAIVREFREVVEKGYPAKDGVRRYPAESKTIVFAETLAHMFDSAFAWSALLIRCQA